MRVARLAAILACVVAVVYLFYFLFGPVYTQCATPLIGPGQTPPPTTCRTMGWLEMTLSEPGPLNLGPLPFLAAWTLAPFVALVATRLSPGKRGLGIVLVLLAFLVEASSIISMGGGFVYALLCGPLLLIVFGGMTVAFAREQMG